MGLLGKLFQRLDFFLDWKSLPFSHFQLLIQKLLLSTFNNTAQLTLETALRSTETGNNELGSFLFTLIEATIPLSRRFHSALICIFAIFSFPTELLYPGIGGVVSVKVYIGKGTMKQGTGGRYIGEIITTRIVITKFYCIRIIVELLRLPFDFYLNGLLTVSYTHLTLPTIYSV